MSLETDASSCVLSIRREWVYVLCWFDDGDILTLSRVVAPNKNIALDYLATDIQRYSQKYPNRKLHIIRTCKLEKNKDNT